MTGAAAAVTTLLVAAPALAGIGAQASTTWTLSSAGSVNIDAAAPGGVQVQLWSNGSARGMVTGSGQLTVHARADLCEGAPRMDVRVDGVRLGEATVSNASGWTAYTLGSFDAAAGEHEVVVTFLNDHRSSTCDRNLRLGGATFRAAPADATVWSLDAAGKVLADPTVPGRIEAQLWSNGTATATASGSGSLTVMARADLCEGAPRMEVTVDGNPAGSATVVNADGWWSYQVSGWPAPAGAHQVVVSFVNDYSNGTCDRNLRLGGAQFEYALSVVSAGGEVTPDAEASTGTLAQQANPFKLAKPYADPYYPSVKAAAERRAAGDIESAELLDKISAHAAAKWIGDWNSTATVADHVRRYAAAANRAGRTGIVVTYAIPGRDCSQHSAGGLTPTTYPAWIRAVADGLRGTRTAVIVEPDALAQLGACTNQGDRAALLRQAVAELDAAGATVYLDAGHSKWIPASTMAYRLKQAGVQQARGFALNVSNFNVTAGERVYGEQVSSMVGGKAFVIDTSRNGNGHNGEWCNPRGRALGSVPRAMNDGTRHDANLWIKRPGQSDGTCNGGPTAGNWWLDMALELARNAAW